MFSVWTLMLQAMQQRMQQQGIRCLLVISGESEWCRQQAQWLAATLPGDWPWIGARPPPGLSALASGAVRQLLGRSGCMRYLTPRRRWVLKRWRCCPAHCVLASWLLLLTPPWRQWHRLTDDDSLRWSDRSQPITTPHFIQHLQRQLAADDEVTLWQQGGGFGTSTAG